MQGRGLNAVLVGLKSDSCWNVLFRLGSDVVRLSDLDCGAGLETDVRATTSSAIQIS